MRKELGIQKTGSWEGQKMDPDLERSRYSSFGVAGGSREQGWHSSLSGLGMVPREDWPTVYDALGGKGHLPVCRAGEESCRLRTERI